jgi:hypothetical protein
MLLVEKTYDAWRGRRVLSLVTFDVQGAYNEVNKDVLKDRLQALTIPEHLAEWIYSFCSDRQAWVAFGSYCSSTSKITYPGLPQGSPLSPILYIVYNATLLHGIIKSRGGEMGFVDDYTAWVTGPSPEENADRIQNEIIPRIVQWEKQSRATFEASKTQFIHFTKGVERAQQPHVALQINGIHVAPSDTMKVLEVNLDSKLRMREHMQTVTRRATKQGVALDMHAARTSARSNEAIVYRHSSLENGLRGINLA